MSDAKTATKAAPKAKASAEKKTKVAPAHPKYLDMAVSALNELKERNGSSRQAIVKFITTKYNVDTKTVNKHVKLALKRGVDTGAIKHVKGQGASGSFKAIPKATKPKKKVQKKTKVAKKPAAKKAAKKAAAPKKEKSVDVPSSPKKSPAKQKKASAAKPKKEKAVAAKPKKEKPTKEKKAKKEKPAKKASPSKTKKAK